MCECCTLSNTLIAKLGFFVENLATNDKFSQAVLLHNRDFIFHSTLTYFNFTRKIVTFVAFVYIILTDFNFTIKIQNCHFCLNYFDRLQFHEENSDDIYESIPELYFF